MEKQKPRRLIIRHTFSAMGRSGGLVRCPCCLTDFRVYWWSLAGCGKRCPGCAALFVGLNGVLLNDLKAASCELPAAS